MRNFLFYSKKFKRDILEGSCFLYFHLLWMPDFESPQLSLINWNPRLLKKKAPSKQSVTKNKLSKGAFKNYVDRILPFFDPPPLRGQFLYPERGQKQTFFDPSPLHLVHVVIEWPLIRINK